MYTSNTVYVLFNMFDDCAGGGGTCVIYVGVMGSSGTTVLGKPTGNRGGGSDAYTVIKVAARTYE